MTNAVNIAQGGTNNVSWRNRLINGNMRIDQRNNGASVTPATGATYALDRWVLNLAQGSKCSVQQNAGSVAPPSGFTNYLGITSLSSYAVAGNESFSVEQIIEGFNVADLAWGTASASPVTLSFWARSSLTGTFGGSIATTKTAIWVMPFSYTIASANTWTFITVAITAPTSTGGTNTGNIGGAFVRFGLGATGTSAGGTAGVWTNAGNYVQPSGTVSVVGTNGATFYITGVQFEAGSDASTFEIIDYGRQLIQCQRYYIGDGTVYGSQGAVDSAYNTEGMFINLPVQMRTTPTVVAYGWVKVGHISGSNTSNPANQSVDATATSLLLRWNSSSSGYRAYGYAGNITPYLSAEL